MQFKRRFLENRVFFAKSAQNLVTKPAAFRRHYIFIIFQTSFLKLLKT